LQDFAPGIRFGRGNGDWHIPLSEDCYGLWSARNHRNLAQFRQIFFQGIDRFHHASQRASPDTGQENGHFKLACKKFPSERQRLGIRFERNLAHRRRDHRIAAMARN